MAAVVAAVVMIVGGALVLAQPKTYESSSSVALLPVAKNPGILPNYPNLIISLIPTYVQLVSSPALLNQVAAKLPFRVSESQLANEVHGESLSNAAIINIVADSSNPRQAQQIASVTTAAFLSQLRGNDVVIPRIYSAPMVSGQPVAPRTSLMLAAVVILAVILGLSAGLVWDRLSSQRDAVVEPGEAAGRPAPARAHANGRPGQRREAAAAQRPGEETPL